MPTLTPKTTKIRYFGRAKIPWKNCDDTAQSRVEITTRETVGRTQNPLEDLLGEAREAEETALVFSSLKA